MQQAASVYSKLQSDILNDSERKTPRKTVITYMHYSRDTCKRTNITSHVT